MNDEKWIQRENAHTCCRASLITPTMIVAFTSDFEIYARWTTAATFDAQGGTSPVPPTKQLTFSEPHGVLPKTTREGYRFLGWFTTATGGSQILHEMIVTSRNYGVPIYAQREYVGPIKATSVMLDPASLNLECGMSALISAKITPKMQEISLSSGAAET